MPDNPQPASDAIIGITGATGFVGQHVVETLISRGHHLCLLIRSPDKMPSHWQDNPQVDIAQGDLSSDLTKFVKNTSTIIHIAGVVKAQKWADYVRANVNGSASVAEAAEAAGVQKLIILSSMTAREPRLSSYAHSKLLGEAAVHKYFDRATVTFRAPAVFGPGDWATKPIFDLMTKGVLPVAGGAWRDVRLAMIYAPDLARVVADAVRSNRYDGQILYPCTTPSISWSEFAELTGAAIDRRVRVLPVPIPALKSVAAMTSLSSRLFGMGHLTLGKLREFRHPDWTSADEVDNPTPMIEALRETARSYGKS